MARSKIVVPQLQLDPVPVRRGNVVARSPFGPRQFADSQAMPLAEASPAPSRQRPRFPVPPEYIGDPIHLTGSVTGLSAGSAGAGVNVKALRNPGPGAMEVWGLKFRLRSSQVITGALVGCRLDLGDFQLTNGYIPVYAFGRAENLVAEQQSDGANPPAAAYATYIARLSRPIYVPAGATIRPQLQHRGLTSATVDVHVSAFGRQLPKNAPLPQKLVLPFWAGYTCKTFTLGTVDSDNSSESDLANPFDVPMLMDRFVGRIGYYSGGQFVFSTSMAEMENSNFGFTTNINTPNIGDALGQITTSIVDSNGYPVVKKLTPFRLLFDAETRSWPLSGYTLPPNSYYLVSMSNAAWIVSNPFTGTNVFAQPYISMLGWREVA